MNEKQKKQIEAILDGLQCSKDFVCYTSGQKKLCKAEDIGLDSYLVCLENDPRGCTFFAVVFGDKHFCQCPLRVYIAKKMKK
jgi:hypothetical protein